MRATACLTVAAILSLACMARADDGTWISNANGTWSTPANWSSNPTVPNGIDQTATLGSIAAPRVVTIDTPITLGALIFASPSGYTVTRSLQNSLTLSVSAGSSQITVNATNGTGANILSAATTLASAVTVANNNTPVLSGTTLVTRALTISGALSGAGDLTVTGPGEVILSGANTSWTGALGVNAGTLTVANSAALGSATGMLDGTTVNPGGTLVIQNGLSLGSETITLAGGTVAGRSGNTAPSSLAGTINITADSTLAAVGTGNVLGGLTINGQITGAANLAITGGNFTATAINPFSGFVTISGGTLAIGSSGSFVTAQRFDLTGGVLSVTRGPGADPVTASIATHSVRLLGGALAIGTDVDAANYLDGSSTGGGLAINVDAYTAGGTNVLNFNNLPGGAALRLGTTTGGSIAGSVVLTPDVQTHTLRFGVIGGSGLLKVAAVLADTSVATQVDQAPGGATELDGINTYTGATTVSGTLTLGNSSALGAGSDTDADGTTVSAGGFLVTLPGVQLANEKITLAGGALNVATNASVNATAQGTLQGTFAGTISGNAPLFFNGPTALNHANTFTGPSTVAQGGKVTLADALGLGAASGTAADGTTVLSGGTLTLAPNVTLSGELITVQAGGLLTSADGSGEYAGPIVTGGGTFSNALFSGQISGTSVIASGSLTFSGPNTYSGTTTLGSGTLTVSSVQGLGSTAAGTLINGGMLLINAASAERITLGGGTLRINAAYTGPLTVNNGNVEVLAPANFAATMFGGNFSISNAFSGSLTSTGGAVFVLAASTATLSLSSTSLWIKAASANSITAVGGTVNVEYLGADFTGPLSVANAPLSILGPDGNGFASLTLLGATAINPPPQFASGRTVRVGVLSGNGSLTANLPLIVNQFNYAGDFVQKNSGQYTTVVSSGQFDIYGATTVSSSIHHDGDMTIYGGGLTINGGASTIGSLYVPVSSLTVNGNLTLGHLGITFGTLAGNGTLTLTDQQLALSAGILAFSGSAPGLTHITKYTEQTAQLQALPSDFTGTVNVQAGELQMLGTIGGSATIDVAAGAHLRLQAGTFSTPLHFHGDARPGDPVLLVGSETNVGDYPTVSGPVDLGPAGATFGSTHRYATQRLTITGSISGGPLTLNPMLDVYLPASGLNFSGLTVNGSTLYPQGALPSVPLTVGPGSRIVLDNSTTLLADRIPDAAPITMRGGMIELIGKATLNTVTSETLGSIAAESGVNALAVHVGSSNGFDTRMTVGPIQRSAGAILDFEDTVTGSFGPNNGMGTSASAPHIFLSGQQAASFLGSGMIYGLYAGPALVPVNFLKYSVADGLSTLTLAEYNNGDQTTWDTGTLVYREPGSTLSLTDSRSVLAARIGLTNRPLATTLDLGTHTLNVVSGSMILGITSSITGLASSHLTAGGANATADLFLFTGGQSQGSHALSANITDNPGADGQYDPSPGGPLDADNGHVSVTFVGPQTFVLSGTNTYSGTTTITSARAGNGFLFGPTIVQYNNAAAIAPGPMVIDAGDVIFNGGFTAATGPVTLRFGTISGTATFSPASLDVQAGTISAALAGAGPVTKTSAGTLTLGNVSAYTGKFSILGGTVAFTTPTVPGNMVLSNATLTPGGAINFTTFVGNIAADSRSDIHHMWIQGATTNAANAHLTLDTTLFSGSLANQGSITITGGTSTFNADLSLKNDGTLRVDGGKLVVASSDAGSTGIFSVILGATLEFGTSYDFASPLAPELEGDGLVIIDAGTSLTIPMDVAFSGSIQVNGTLILAPARDPSSPADVTPNFSLVPSSPIPEPGTAGVYGVAALSLLVRRRRLVPPCSSSYT